jgi:hypothetical protein
MVVEHPMEKQSGNVVFLVGTHPTVAAPKESVRLPEQLAIEFERPRQLLVVVSDRLHGATFLRHLLKAKPKVLLDFRFAPHFSFTAVDGATIKHQIDASGTKYVQCPIPFHEFGPSLLRHDPSGIALRLPECARANGVLNGPLMVLVKDAAVARALTPFLLSALHHDLGGKWVTELVA